MWHGRNQSVPYGIEDPCGKLKNPMGIETSNVGNGRIICGVYAWGRETFHMGNGKSHMGCLLEAELHVGDFLILNRKMAFSIGIVLGN